MNTTQNTKISQIKEDTLIVGVDIYNVPITVDTRISVVPVLQTPTQDVPLLLITVPM